MRHDTRLEKESIKTPDYTKGQRLLLVAKGFRLARAIDHRDIESVNAAYDDARYPGPMICMDDDCDTVLIARDEDNECPKCGRPMRSARSIAAELNGKRKRP